MMRTRHFEDKLETKTRLELLKPIQKPQVQVKKKTLITPPSPKSFCKSKKSQPPPRRRRQREKNMTKREGNDK